MVKLPLEILFNDKLNGNDIRLYGVFIALITKNVSDEVSIYKNDKEEYVVSGEKTKLAEISKLPVASFTKSLKNLEEHKLVKVSDKRKKLLEIVVSFDDSINPPDKPVRKINSHVKEKLAETYVLSEEDKKIVEIAKYYDIHVREFKGLNGFKSLPVKKDPRQSDNWKYFVKLYNLCKEKGWDYRAYIDAQFERAKYWKNGMYPYPRMLAGKKMQQYYLEFEENRRKKSGFKADDDWVKFKPKFSEEEKSLVKKVVKDVKQAVETMELYAKKGFNPEKQDRVIRKFDELIYNWHRYPSAYLYHVTWVWSFYREQLEGIAENSDSTISRERAKKVIEDFKRFDKSKVVQEAIRQAVEKYEKKHGIISTPSEEEFVRYIEQFARDQEYVKKAEQDLKTMKQIARKKFTSPEAKAKYGTWEEFWEKLTDKYINDWVQQGVTEWFIYKLKSLRRQYGQIVVVADVA